MVKYIIQYMVMAHFCQLTDRHKSENICNMIGNIVKIREVAKESFFNVRAISPPPLSPRV